MKVLIILFFITFVYSQEGQCTNITYSLEGERCDGLTRKCKIFTVCNQTESVCRKGSIGDFCISSSDCFLSGGSQEGVRCVENKCIKPRYNGYSCSKNEHVREFYLSFSVLEMYVKVEFVEGRIMEMLVHQLHW